LSINDTEKLVNTFVSSRLDLCNACPLQWLQLAQNVARDYWHKIRYLIILQLF